LGLLLLTNKIEAKKVDFLIGGGFSQKSNSKYDIIATGYEGSKVHDDRQENLDKLTIYGLATMNLRGACVVRLDDKYEKKAGDVSYTDAFGEGSYSKNNLELTVEKETKLKEKLSGLIAGGFGLRNKDDSGSISIKTTKSPILLESSSKRKNQELIVGGQLEYNGLPVNIALKTKYAHKINGEQTFEVRNKTTGTSVKREYDLSGSRLENEVALKKEINKKNLKGLELRLSVDIDNDKLKQTSTTETTTPVYEDYTEKRIYYALQAVAYFKENLALKLGIGQEDLNANGTLEVKTTQKPTWAIVGVEWTFGLK